LICFILLVGQQIVAVEDRVVIEDVATEDWG